MPVAEQEKRNLNLCEWSQSESHNEKDKTN